MDDGVVAMAVVVDVTVILTMMMTSAGVEVDAIKFVFLIAQYFSGWLVWELKKENRIGLGM